MTPWLLQRLAFNPHVYAHTQEASYAFRTESEAIQEFARQFAEHPGKCTGKIFAVSNSGRTTRKFWIAADLRVTDLEAKEPDRIIAQGFQTTRLQSDLRNMPPYVTTVALIRHPMEIGPRFGAASLDDAKDRAALICFEDFVRIDIYERRSFVLIGRATMTDAGPAFTPSHEQEEQPALIRPRQVAEVLRYAELQGQTLS